MTNTVVRELSAEIRRAALAGLALRCSSSSMPGAAMLVVEPQLRRFLAVCHPDNLLPLEGSDDGCAGGGHVLPTPLQVSNSPLLRVDTVAA